MNREVHVRIWERPEVRVLWATRHEGQFAPATLSGRSAFSEETFAGRCGNEKERRLRTFAPSPRNGEVRLFTQVRRETGKE